MEDDNGIRCAKCGGKTRTLLTRTHDEGIRRRRECKVCGTRVTTVEISREEYLMLKRKSLASLTRPNPEVLNAEISAATAAVDAVKKTLNEFGLTKT